MEQLNKIRNIFHYLTSFITGLSMFLLIPLMLLTTFDVISRRVFGWPISGAVELSEYILAVVILLGIAYTQQVKGHPRVTFVTDRLPPTVQQIIEITTIVLSLFITYILLWQGWVLMGRMGGIVSDVLRIPQLAFRFLVVVGAGLLFLELLADLSISMEKLFRGLFSKGKQETTI